MCVLGLSTEHIDGFSRQLFAKIWSSNVKQHWAHRLAMFLTRHRWYRYG